MAKKRVADLLVETLTATGVQRFYGVARESLNSITDAIRRRDDIRWVPVRHEEMRAESVAALVRMAVTLGLPAARY